MVSVNVHKDGRYAFVEFRSPEYATAALQLNGQVTLMGTTISIGRPAAYVDPNKVAEAAQQAEMAVAMHKAGIVPPLPGPAGVAASAGALAQVFPGGVVSAVPMPVPPAGIPPPAPPPGGPPPPEAAAAAAAVAAAAVGAVPTQNLAAEPGFSVLPTEHVVVGGIVTAAVLEDDDDYLDVSCCKGEGGASCTGLLHTTILRHECNGQVLCLGCGRFCDVAVPPVLRLLVAARACVVLCSQACLLTQLLLFSKAQFPRHCLLLPLLLPAAASVLCCCCFCCLLPPLLLLCT